MKVLRLESYEDTLGNIEMRRITRRGICWRRNWATDVFHCGICDVAESRICRSPRSRTIEGPFSYKLKVSTSSAGESRLTKVDLVETFTYLLGLRVKHIDSIRGFTVVQGTNPAGEKTLVIWRNVRETSSSELDDFFVKQKYNTRDMEFDLIYVNGDRQP